MDDGTEGGLLGDYFAENELATEFGVTVRTIQRWREDRKGPPVTFPRQEADLPHGTRLA
jgi:hypothetical protein